MTATTTPADLARAALRRIAEQRIAPTPSLDFFIAPGATRPLCQYDLRLRTLPGEQAQVDVETWATLDDVPEDFPTTATKHLVQTNPRFGIVEANLVILAERLGV